MDKARIAIIGASGYTGAELVRLVATHPGMQVAALAADRNAGRPLAEIYPHLSHLDLPMVTTTRSGSSVASASAWLAASSSAVVVSSASVSSTESSCSSIALSRLTLAAIFSPLPL